MNKISIALNAVLLIAVAVLFYLYFSLNSKLNPSTEGATEKGKTTPKLITDPSKLNNAKIAYINIDSLNAKYQFITDKSQEINKRQMALENTLNSMYGKFQQEVADLQQAAQAGLRSEAELRKEEERLQVKQQDIANKEKQLQALGEEVANTQANMLRSVSKFIEKYNDNKFDYILAYTSNNISSVLFAKSELEITNEIVDGLNKEYAETKATAKK
ncbi:MAG: OmpH family outer membrane protein [Bacteroidetes bacterium]|jgi:outer membrane protein|nr:OmpH family outer membrane protein [Bacteroidota bacterium]